MECGGKAGPSPSGTAMKSQEKTRRQKSEQRSTFTEGAQMAVDPPPAVLIELVERFQVGWEIVPENPGQVESRIRFTLKLTARHDSPVDHPVPNCVHCHNVFLFLHVIADWLSRGRNGDLCPTARFHFPARLIHLGGKHLPTFVLRFAWRTAKSRKRRRNVWNVGGKSWSRA
jgi:hypothetical protein